MNQIIIGTDALLFAGKQLVDSGDISISQFKIMVDRNKKINQEHKKTWIIAK